MFAPGSHFDLADPSLADPRREIEDWFSKLSHLSVKALVVLGPDPFGPASARKVLTVFPLRHTRAAELLCSSDSYGEAWRESRSPMVGWVNLKGSDSYGNETWRRHWIEDGMSSMVHVEIPLPLGRAFECFVFSQSEASDRAHAAEVAYALLSSWPTLKPILLSDQTSITSRERESLIAAAEGLTAREAAVRMSCTERTVNHHWSRAMIKMRATNKIAAVQRAVWLGLI